MAETLKDVGTHFEYTGGHHEATVEDDGKVIIRTIFNSDQKHTVTLKRDEWYRLAAWVAWAEGDWKPQLGQTEQRGDTGDRVS